MVTGVPLPWRELAWKTPGIHTIFRQLTGQTIRRLLEKRSQQRVSTSSEMIESLTRAHSELVEAQDSCFRLVGKGSCSFSEPPKVTVTAS